MIHKDELKMRVLNYGNHLADMYFAGDDFASKFAASTTKYIIKQKLYAIDEIVDLFADKNGEINDDELIAHLCDNLIGDNGLRLCVRQFIDNDLVKNMLPDKVILLTKEDVHKLFRG